MIFNDTHILPALQWPRAGSPSAYNDTGSALAKDKLVYVSGVQGVRPEVTLADADTYVTSSGILYVTTSSINDSDFGIVAPWKVLTGLDTSAGTAGDPVYLSGTAGGWSLTAGANARRVGIVLVSSATVGQVFLCPGAFAPAPAAAISDPGDGAAIPVNRSGTVAITTGAAGETNTLAIPTFLGQRLVLTHDVDGGGNRVITAASAINVAGNTIMTFDTARDTIELVAIQLAGALAWEVAWNNNVALS